MRTQRIRRLTGTRTTMQPPWRAFRRVLVQQRQHPWDVRLLPLPPPPPPTVSFLTGVSEVGMGLKRLKDIYLISLFIILVKN